MTCMVMCAFDALYAVPDRSLWNHQALYHAWRVEVLQMVSILRYIMSLYCKLILIFSCISHTAFVYWMISHTALFVNVARNSDKMRKTKRAGRLLPLTRAGETIFCLCTCREKTQTVRVRSKHRTIRVTMCACLHLTVMWIYDDIAARRVCVVIHMFFRGGALRQGVEGCGHELCDCWPRHHCQCMWHNGAYILQHFTRDTNILTLSCLCFVTRPWVGQCFVSVKVFISRSDWLRRYEGSWKRSSWTALLLVFGGPMKCCKSWNTLKLSSWR
jgi:hypothetical protein